ncbi:Bactoprenol glucosyl transferase [Enterobacter kobei]
MKISLVVPVFNEEEAIPIFYKTVREFEGLQQHDVEIIFINDDLPPRLDTTLS